MLPPGAAHGAVALTEHQTEGRGRLGRTWIDEPGTGLLFSVVLLPPPPVAVWPELTLVAAEAVAGAIGPDGVDQAPERRAGRREEGGRDPRGGTGARGARDRRSTSGARPGPAPARSSADRLALLVDVLERLELGYESWLARVTR